MGLFGLSKKNRVYYESTIKDKDIQISRLQAKIESLSNNNNNSNKEEKEKKENKKDKEQHIEDKKCIKDKEDIFEKCNRVSKDYGNTKIGKENLNLIYNYRFLKMWVGAKTSRIYAIEKNDANTLLELLREKDGQEHIQLKLLNIVKLSSIDIDNEEFNSYLIDKSLQRALIKDIELGDSDDILSYLEDEGYNYLLYREMYGNND